MAEAALQPTPKPTYILPSVKKFKPVVGDLITRPIGYRSSNIFPDDPWAISRGRETYKYADASLHPEVAKALRFVINGPFWAGWGFHADNDYDRYPAFEQRDEIALWLINYQVKKMQYETFNNVLKSLWKDACVEGFTMGEMGFYYDGEYWIVQSIKTHSPFLFDLKTDKGYNLDEIYYGKKGLTIPRQLLPKFLVGTYPFLEHGKYYGTSRLQSIYFDVQLLKLLEQAQAEGIRALAIKPIIHYYASTKKSGEELDAVKAALYNIDSGSLVSLPSVLGNDDKIIRYDEFEVLEDRASAEGIALISNVLDVIYKRINRSLGLPDDLGFSTTTIGSLAKAKEEANLFSLTLADDQTWIESFVNRKIIPAMIRYNYPSWVDSREYNLPQFRFGSVEEEADSTTIQNLLDMQEGGFLNVKDPIHWDYILEKLKIPKASMPTALEPDEILDPDQAIPAENKLKRLISQIVRGKRG